MRGGEQPASKGESVADTIRMISGYADIAAMRHFKEGAPYVASLICQDPCDQRGGRGTSAPYPNLNRSAHNPPEKGKISGVTIGLCGDLKFGRRYTR